MKWVRNEPAEKMKRINIRRICSSCFFYWSQNTYVPAAENEFIFKSDSDSSKKYHALIYSTAKEEEDDDELLQLQYTRMRLHLISYGGTVLRCYHIH